MAFAQRAVCENQSPAKVVMAFIVVFVLAAQVRAELISCDDIVDATFQHLLALEWSDGPDTVSVRIECDEALVKVTFAGPVAQREEPVSLAGLSAAARARLLAVIVGERGRAWLEGALEPVRRPLALSVEPTKTDARPLTTSEIATALWRVRRSTGLNPWRVSAGAVSALGSLGPPRFGGTVRASLGLVSVTASVLTTSFTAQAGLVTLTHGTLSTGVTLLSVEGTGWQVCARARLVGGFGGALATPSAGFVATRADTWLFGGEGELTVVVAPVSALFVELSLAGGWTSGVMATIDGAPFASLGGWGAGLSLAVGASWR